MISAVLQRGEAQGARRLEAIALLARGLKQAEIARKLGVTREAVRKWRKSYIMGGIDALTLPKARKSPVVPRNAIAKLLVRLAAHPERFGLSEMWSSVDLAKLLERKFGVRYASRHVQGVLRSMGYEFVPTRGWQHTTREDPQESPPWGFKYDRGGQLVRDKRELRIQCMTREMYVDGEPVDEIVKFLGTSNKMDRDGRSIGHAQVREMLFGSEREAMELRCCSKGR